MSGNLGSGLQLRKRGLVGNGNMELPICTLTEVSPELGRVTTLQRTVLMQVWGTKHRGRLEDEGEVHLFVPERYIPAIWGILNVTEQYTFRKMLGVLNRRNQGLFRHQQKIFLTLNTHHSRYHRDQIQ